MATLSPLPLLKMNLNVLRWSDYLEVARRIVERVTVNVVDMLLRRQLSPKKALHDKSMFGFIVPVGSHDISIAVLNVLPGENLGTNWFAIAPHQGVVISAKPLGQSREIAVLNTACQILMAIQLLTKKWVTVFIPATVMLAAQASAYTRPVATINRAIRSLFWHRVSIAQGRC